MTLSMDLFHLINELIFLFHHYNTWEDKLLNALRAPVDLKELLRIFGEICPYPIIFMELDGSILALSENYADDEINEDWFLMKSTRQVPMSSNRSQYNEIYKDVFADETPRLFQNESGDSYIAMYFTRNQIRFMGMIVMEYQTPFTPDLFQLCTFLGSAINSSQAFARTENVHFRTKASILYDFLENNPVNALDLDRFYENESFIFPWQLITISSNKHLTGDVVSYVIDSFRKNTKLKSVILDYNGTLTAMVQQVKLPLFLEEIKKLINPDHYRIGISLPFHSLQKMSLRYQQAEFARNAEKEAGIRFCQDYALNYMMHSIRQNQNAMEMVHPALEILKTADERKNSQLYETLWTYLNHDRSIHATSEAMFVHRNSLLYRMKRIRELTGINLDNLKECEYLRVSYMIENDHMFF